MKQGILSIWLVIVCLVATSFALVATPRLIAKQEGMQNRIDRWLADRNALDPSKLTPEERLEAIAELKRIEGRPVDEVNLEFAQRYLIELGDMQTAENILREIGTPRSIEILSYPRQAWLIPMLAPALTRDEAIQQVYGRGEHWHQSAAAAFVMLRLIKNCPALPTQVRESVHPLDYEQDFRKLRAASRQWWQQNKEHFEKQDYAAVTPLQPLSGAVPGMSPEPVAAPLKTNATVAAAAESVPSVEAPVSARQASPTPPQPAPTRSFMWPVIMGVLTLVAIGMVAWRKMRE